MLETSVETMKDYIENESRTILSVYIIYNFMLTVRWPIEYHDVILTKYIKYIKA